MEDFVRQAAEQPVVARKNENLIRQKDATGCRPSHKEIERLIASLPTILIGLSREHEIVYWNAKTAEVFGIAASDVIGLPLSQCGIDWDWEKVADGISQSRRENRPINVDDVELRRPPGEERYLGLTINASTDDDDSLLELLIIGADITERKKLQAQLQQSHKMEALGQLAAGIAHEINTPTQFVGDNIRFFQDAFDELVRIVHLYRELLEAGKSRSLSDERINDVEKRISELDFEYLAEEIPLAIQQTLKGVDRITKIVQAMKIFAHPGMLKKEPTDINQELGKTVTITRNEWKYVAELTTDFDAGLPLVNCFRAEFNQVILNLIVNAAHAIAEANRDNPNQKGTIRIKTRQDGNWAEISIADTGAGIPKEIRHKIFDLFFTTKGPGKGSGQGLAIAHSVIVEKHHGAITVESQEKKGTTFVIRLPIEADPEEHE